MTGKAENIRPKHTFLAGEGGVRCKEVRDMALPSLGNLGAMFSEMSFPRFKTYFMQISHCSL